MKITKDWLVGFVDGEGCFFVGINKNPTMKLGYQVVPEFRIVQHKRDVKLLFSIRTFFGHGFVVTNKGRDSDIMEYRLRKLEHLKNVLLPFFESNELLTSKKFNFYIFRDIVNRMHAGNHLTLEGLDEIRRLKSRMNRGMQMKIESELDGNIKRALPFYEEPTN